MYRNNITEEILVSNNIKNFQIMSEGTHNPMAVIHYNDNKETILRGDDEISSFINNLVYGFKKEVKYLDIVVGIYDGETIDFLDNKEAQEIKEHITRGNSIGISQRRLGVVNENGKVDYTKKTDYSIIKFYKEK